MTTIVERLLKKFGVQPRIERDEINESIENKAQELNAVIGKLRKHLSAKNNSVEHLRESIAIARERTHSFEDFERMTTGRLHAGGGKKQ